MGRLFSILFFIVMLAGTVTAQEANVVPVMLHAAQQVLVTGEDLWVDGAIGTGAEEAKIAHLQLLDRNGNAKAEVSLPIRNERFQGFIEMPATLVSDYYFIDASLKGFSTRVTMVPLMLINPVLPPVTCATPVAPAVMAEAQSPLVFSTQKNSYGLRERATLQFAAGTAAQANIYISRADALSALLESESMAAQLTRQHPAKGRKETEGHTLSVKVQAVGGGPATGVRVLAAMQGGQALMATGSSDEKGSAQLILPLVYGERPLVLSAVPNKGQRYRLELVDEAPDPLPVAFPCLRLDESMRKAIEARLMNLRLAKEYRSGDIRQFQFDDRDTSDFYGKPDRRYLLDDYVRFPNMQEILEEFVPEVRVRNAKDPSPLLEVLNTPLKSYFNESGFILLDGIPVFNTRELMDMNPLLLESVDVMSRRYLLGDWELSGVVQYKSYKRDLAGYTLTADQVIYPFTGIQEKAFPANADQRITGKRTPDFGNLLYREINVETVKGATIPFFTGDAAGDYLIKVVSTDAGGREQESRTRITVR